MSVPLWAAELAGIFWMRAREDEPFPRSLRRPSRRGLPFSIVDLPELTIKSAATWLAKNGIVCELPGQNRVLRACLIARWGHGFAILEQNASEDESRFSLAHELAHFLKEYWYVRTEATRRLGPAALEVMDGVRPPSADERLQSLLHGVALGFHIHLMERDDDGGIISSAIAHSEAHADRLAFELLAPAAHVFANGATHDERDLTARLQSYYGLPRIQAARYARILKPVVHADPLILRFKNLTGRAEAEHGGYQ